MAITVAATITHNRFPEIARKMPEAARKAVSKTSFGVEAHAKNVVPVDTGNLKNSIGVEFENDGLTGIIGTNVEYGVFVEYGTSNPGYPVQPYMTPAAEVNAPAFRAAMVQLIERL